MGEGGGGQGLERGGGYTRERGGGRLKNPKGLGGGWLGLGGKLVGRIKIHGPTRSHVNSRPQRMSLTKILLFYW
jgi:hypothetical protein